jgi:membrane protease subunit HflC
MRTFLIIFVVIVILCLGRLSLYSVDATEYAYVTQLGQHLVTHDGGSADDGPGLHVGWPWPVQSVIRLDRRLQFFDLPGPELLTHDPKSNTIGVGVIVETYVCWRIANADAVDRFIKSMGTADQAKTILGQRINSQLGAAIGRMKMEDLISTRPGKAPGTTQVDETIAGLQRELLASLRDPVNKDYGIELVDVRLRRFNHPEEVRPTIFARIRSEREKKVTEYQSEGNKQAKKIESETDELVRGLKAEARYKEEKLKGEADNEAIRLRNEAHSQDPEFYAFLKKLDKLQSILGDNKTILLLSSHRPIFDLLFQPPRPNGTMNGTNGKAPDPKKGGGK